MTEPWEDYSEGPWADYDMTGPTDRAPPKKKKSFSLGVMRSATTVLDKIPSPFGKSEYDRENRAKLESYMDERERREIPSTAGKITGSVLTTLPVMAVTKNPFAQGAIQGGLTSEADSPGGVAADAAVGAGLNWAGGKVIDAVSDFVSPVIDPAVRRMADSGVKLTPGMIKGPKAMAREDKMMSRPVVGETIAAARRQTQSTFNTAAVNRALEPLGVTVPAPVRPGFDTIDYAKAEISRAYDRVIPNISVTMNGQQFSQAVAPVAQNMKDEQRRHFLQIVDNELGNGQLAGQQLKSAQGNIRRLAANFTRSDDPNNQMLGEALWAVDEELTNAMMAQNPQFAPQLAKVNSAYRGYRIVADAAGRADDGVFNTGQLKQSVRRGDRTKSKDATARGKAFMQGFSNDAREVIPARTPDSGTAGRLAAPNIFANAAARLLMSLRGR